MKIKWNGHASFTITSDKGTVIVTDPYDPKAYGKEFTYEAVRDRADGVLISHGHADHNYANGLKGSPVVLRDSGVIKGISVAGIRTFHDESGGSKRGSNMVFRFTLEDMTLCFLGDLGHILSEEQIEMIRPVDILFIPVGGTYTIDAGMAARVIDQVRPKAAIPMHFRTKRCGFPITGVDDFLFKMKGVTKPGKSEIEISPDKLPSGGTEVWVLDHAC